MTDHTPPLPEREPVRLYGWAAIGATLVLEAIILVAAGTEPLAIAGVLALAAFPLLGLERGRRSVSSPTTVRELTRSRDAAQARETRARVEGRQVGRRDRDAAEEATRRLTDGP